MTTEQIIAQLEARAEQLTEEHGRVERALAELRPEHAAEPAKPIRQRRRLTFTEIKGRVAAVLQDNPEDSFTIKAVAEIVDYNTQSVDRALKELVEGGHAKTVPSQGIGVAAKFPRYQHAQLQLARSHAA